MHPAPARKYVTNPPAAPGLVIAGYDPGITTPALAIVQRKPGGGFGCLFHKVIRTDSAMPDDDRFDILGGELFRAFAKYRPAYTYGEEQRTVQSAKQNDGERQFNANNSKTIESVGVCRCASHLAGAKYRQVRTQTARVEVMGKGNKSASKKQVQAFIKVVLGVQLPQDAAEAALNALFGFQLQPSERRKAG